MLRGIFTAASGMNAEMLEQDVVANNIANANTVGFKKDAAVLEAFPNMLVARIHDRLDQTQQAPAPAILQNVGPTPLLGVVGQGVEPAATVPDFTQGTPQRTDQPFDFALQGNGLFTVQKGDGSIAYTRAGNFTLNGNKDLCTMDGNLVLGTDRQPIHLDGDRVVVDTGGNVKVDGQEVGTMQVVAYDPQTFTKAGDGLYDRHEPLLEGIDAVNKGIPSGINVLQGYIEQSNVQVVTEMVHMISLMRAYEQNSKAINMQDETLAKLITTVGTPA